IFFVFYLYFYIFIFFLFFFFFFFNDTATTEIYTVGNTLSLHDALPTSPASVTSRGRASTPPTVAPRPRARSPRAWRPRCAKPSLPTDWRRRSSKACCSGRRGT